MWVKQRPGRYYGALTGCLLWQLQRLLKIKLQNEDGTSVEYSLDLSLTTVPENSGKLDPVSEFVQVRHGLAVVALEVFSMGYIVGYAHVMSEIATSSMKGDGWNERWIVNSHIDLATWNNGYN
jgi:hypothetical protein